MKIVQINTFPNKSTGNIMMNIHNFLLNLGMESYVVWGRGRKSNNEYEISLEDKLEVRIHGAYTRFTDKTGFASSKSTRKLLKILDIIKPNIIHLHNIHGYYLNIELLFDYIKKNNIRVIWTLHDCWSFTGHCAYFDMVQCEKWKYGCNKCKNKKSYPASYLLDNSYWNWKKKKELFTGLNINLITPSNWLKENVKNSFMKCYPVNVIYNGIDLEVFKPLYNREEMKKKNNFSNDKIVLGIASEWTDRKGLNDFIKLANLSENKYKIIIVGLNKKQINSLPNNILKIPKIDNIQKLIELYSIADIFVNPTYEDNFPTTNIEALACGTPVITYDTGGSYEIIEMAKEKKLLIGEIVHKKHMDTSEENAKLLNQEILRFFQKIEENVNIRENCRNYAKKFNKNIMLNQYLELYKEILKEKI